MEHTKFDSANLENADFTGSVLGTSCTFRNANLKNANFSNADLTKSSLAHAYPHSSGANLCDKGLEQGDGP